MITRYRPVAGVGLMVRSREVKMTATIARIVSVFCFILCAAAPSNGAEKLRVAYPTLGPGSTPSWVTHETGFWKKSGLDVELILLSGGARMLPALVSGSVDIILGSDTGVTLANLQGANLVRIGVTMNSLGYSLVTQPSIRSIRELKGKVLGTGRGRDASYARLVKILSDNGLNPASDVKFLPVGETPTGRLQAIKNGLVHGAVFTPPLDLVGSRDGLTILHKIDVPTLGGGINTTAPLVQQKRKALLTFLRAYMEGIRYTTTHKAESLKVFFKYFRNPDTEALSYLYDDTAPRIARNLRPNPESVRSILDQIAIDDPRAKQLSEKDHWDLTLLDEIQKSGGAGKAQRP
jgi:NitT/TauT family transport system substrate-binding protein